jgi:hypothetical protein
MVFNKLPLSVASFLGILASGGKRPDVHFPGVE